jgi:hypothetical protein
MTPVASVRPTHRGCVVKLGSAAVAPTARITDAEPARRRPMTTGFQTMHDLRRFFKANPQVLVLLLICLVLGIGTFLAVVFGIVTSKSTTATGEPSGSVGTRVVMSTAHTVAQGVRPA